jgi:hypothetical protein
VDVFAGFTDYCIEQSRSLDILCRNWAPDPHIKRPNGSDEPDMEDKLPTWIPSVRGSEFGGREAALQGRLNGESLVGTTSGNFSSLNRRLYDAAAGLWPSVRFGRQPAPAKSWSKWLQSVTRVSTYPSRPQL